MNPIISSELTLFSQEIQRFLSPRVLKETAQMVGFVRRSSKYQADELIALCVWFSQEVASTSLTQLCSRLEASTGVLISQEGVMRWPSTSYPKMVTSLAPVGTSKTNPNPRYSSLQD